MSSFFAFFLWGTGKYFLEPACPPRPPNNTSQRQQRCGSTKRRGRRKAYRGHRLANTTFTKFLSTFTNILHNQTNCHHKVYQLYLCHFQGNKKQPTVQKKRGKIAENFKISQAYPTEDSAFSAIISAILCNPKNKQKTISRVNPALDYQPAWPNRKEGGKGAQLTEVLRPAPPKGRLPILNPNPQIKGREWSEKEGSEG